MPHPLTACDSAVAWLFGTQEKGVKLGLDNIRRLLEALDNPQRNLRFFHVAGTNGKGSVCALLESILRAQGFKTGLFTSPHLVRFNERIQVGGKAIADESIVSGIERIRALIDEKHHPTFFEITTALALDYFREQEVEFVLLETGLGGRMDATNVVTPVVSILTSIDLDHQKWLGATRAEIAYEKAGIIKRGVPVVSVPQLAEVSVVIERVAQEKETVVTYVEGPVTHWPVSLPGSHQRVNAAAAIKAIQLAGIRAGQEAIKFGLANAIWPGRFQTIDQKFILDGAHNVSATKRLVQTWREQFGAERPVIIFGGLADKDLAAMAAILGEIALHFFLAPINSPRAAAPFEVQEMLPEGASFTLCSSMEDALERAKVWPAPVLITGSLFLAGEALAILQPGRGIAQFSSQ
jgi:dihydrofolate synthase / folylpolyglutamate synthase